MDTTTTFAFGHQKVLVPYTAGSVATYLMVRHYSGRLVTRLITTAFLLLMVSSIASAEGEGEQPKPPATKLEAFQARTGVVLIRGYTTVGVVSGRGGIVTVDARELRDASNPNSRATGISISVEETGRLQRENTSYVDADEIDSLLKGIEYIMKIGKDVTKLQNFEVDYRTKGDLRITVYNDAKGQISAAVSSGRIGRTQAFIELRDLEEFRKLILAAKAKL